MQSDLCGSQFGLSAEGRLSSLQPGSFYRGQPRADGENRQQNICLSIQTRQGGAFMGSDLCYSDGVDPEQQGVFIFTAQELDVV